MKKITVIKAAAVPFDASDVDTDQIIPARFLRRPRSVGYADILFHDLRFDQNAEPRPDFVLNDPGYAHARIVVANANFGTGSSREGAVYALADYGMECVIAASFGDIFYNNSIKNGLLPVVLPATTLAGIRAALHASPGTELTVNLPDQTVTGPDGAVHAFQIAPSAKRRLVEGLDDIGLTRSFRSEIDAFERSYKQDYPWLGATRSL